MPNIKIPTDKFVQLTDAIASALMETELGESLSLYVNLRDGSFTEDGQSIYNVWNDEAESILTSNGLEMDNEI